MTVYVIGEALPNDEFYIYGIVNNHAEAHRCIVELNQISPFVTIAYQEHKVFDDRISMLKNYEAEEAKLEAEREANRS
jgi:hypothetical protein